MLPIPLLIEKMRGISATTGMFLARFFAESSGFFPLAARFALQELARDTQIMSI
jgi:hypothetical protein